MKKKTFLIISLLVISLTCLMVLVGNYFAKEDHEKQNGLTDIFTLSSTNQLAYVQYSKGKPLLFIADQNGENQQLIAEKSAYHTISDLAFSHDGKKLLYIVNNKDLENNTSELFEYNLEKDTKRALLVQKNSIITEAIYAPDRASLYLLGAGTFENYSPIARKNPHDFNIFQYHLTTKQLEQLTQLDSYSIDSLAVSKNGEKLYFIQDEMPDASSNSEEIFNSKMRIFELTLSSPHTFTILHTLEQDVYDFTISPNEKELVIQAVADTNEKGTYIYELFSYNLETKEEQQLTQVNEYVGQPIYSNDGSQIYFIVNFNFASNTPEYSIHYLNRSNKKIISVLKSKD